jgi:hypothetical protein
MQPRRKKRKTMINMKITIKRVARDVKLRPPRSKS